MGNENEKEKSSLSLKEKGDQLKKIIKKTYFTYSEGKEIYNGFSGLCPSDELDQEHFLKAFPQFKKHEKLRKSIFRAMDNDNGGGIGFPEYIQALSIMARGTPEEKAKFALSIIDLNGDKKIEQKELIAACSEISEITHLHTGVESEVSVENVINRIYARENESISKYTHSYYVKLMKKQAENGVDVTKDFALFEKQKQLEFKLFGGNAKKLSYKEFTERAVHDQEFLSCFGLFLMFYVDIIKPIEEKTIKIKERIGGLPIMKGYITSANWQFTRRWCEVSNEFLVLYEDEKHAKAAKKRWSQENKGTLMGRGWDGKDEMNLELESFVKGARLADLRFIAIGIRNCTKHKLMYPQLFVNKGGAGSKKAKEVVLPGEYATVSVKTSGMRGVSGIFSYEIANSSKRFGVLFRIPSDYRIHGNLIFCRIFEDTQKLDTKLYQAMKGKGEADRIEMAESGYQFKGIVGNEENVKEKFNKRKVTLRIELHHAEHVPPPSLVCNLQEANVKFLSGSPDSFEFNVYNYKRVFTVPQDQLEKWIYAIRCNSNTLKPKPFGSYAHPHKGCGAQFFVGGQEYFTEVAKCLKKAHTEILITGWFITPTLYLTRDGKGAFSDSLHEILLERAKHGVLIKVLVWDEIDAAFMLGSKWVKDLYMGLHKNFQVIRDPLNRLNLYSHHQKTVTIDQHISFVGGIDLAYNRYEDVSTFQLTDEESLKYPGLTYVNPMVGGDNLAHRHWDAIDRSQIPRMPWQDIHCKVTGGAARDIARNFIQRWNVSLGGGCGLNYIALREKPCFEKSKDEPYPNCTVQAIRSGAKWSVGNNTIEQSIYKSQVDAIRNSKHFIYIENQFMISGVSPKQINPKNRLLKVIVARLKKAIANQEKFRFIFVTPVHSSSPMGGVNVQQITFWQQKTMIRGKYSLFELLRKEFPNEDIEDYIIICCLRNWGKFKRKSKYCTEMVYVHSKMMIVDDDIAFISSANINDRSMLGNRDSEIGFKIKDDDEIDVPMGGVKVKCGKYAHDLRMHCFRVHLGYGYDKSHDDEFRDPIKYYNTWREIAYANQNIYKTVFGQIEDTVRSTSKVGCLTDYCKTNKPRCVKKLKNLKGYVVPFPRDFLWDSWRDPSKNSTSLNKFYV